MVRIKKSKKDKIDEILKKYDLYSIYNKLPNHLNTEAVQKYKFIEEFMQSKYNIRGILKSSKIIFDEPLAETKNKRKNNKTYNK